MNAVKWTIATAILVALGCGNEGATDAPKRAVTMPTAPASGKADARTDFYTDMRGALSLDDTRFDAYAPTWAYYYNGYEVELQAGDVVTFRAGGASDGFDTVIGLYGPQSSFGQWGEILDANDDANGTLDSELAFEATESGTYLLLAQDYDWNPGELWVSAECEGGPCASTQCPDVVCALWCDDGFVRDANGCETCECEPAPGTAGEGCSMYGDQCAAGFECSYRCADGSDTPNCNLGINPTGTCVAESVSCTDGDTQLASDGCNTCTCSGGAWACTEIACTPPECVTDSDCIQTGCSGQICAPEPVVSTCEWHPDYACYNSPTTSCGCNAGSCGWQQTPELASCLGS